MTRSMTITDLRGHHVELDDVQNDDVLIRLECVKCGALGATGNGLSTAYEWATRHQHKPSKRVWQR